MNSPLPVVVVDADGKGLSKAKGLKVAISSVFWEIAHGRIKVGSLVKESATEEHPWASDGVGVVGILSIG